jgi:hypothetical protein
MKSPVHPHGPDQHELVFQNITATHGCDTNRATIKGDLCMTSRSSTCRCQNQVTASRLLDNLFKLDINTNAVLETPIVNQFLTSLTPRQKCIQL